MFPKALLLAFSLLAVVKGQQVGTLTTETHPPLTVQQCTSSGSCTTLQRNIVLDSNWRWLHSTKDSTNCYTGNTWDKTLCPNPTTCASNCAVDGADYSGTYGITTSGNALTLKFVTKGPYSTNIGSRVYLMDTASTYQMFNLNNQEFTFDVDMSNLPCGLNGALYFVQMDKDGGMSKYSGNKAGAKYGTGYCDTQCPHDIKFINGEANTIGWTPASNDANAGKGQYGACCNEMDIWEANNNAAAYTPHVCSGSGGQTRCSGTDCGDGDDRYKGICDKDGCDFNSFRMGDKNFLGPGKTVNTNQKFTVVTQFISTGSSLTEIRRLYVQNGKVIANSKSTFSGLTQYNSISDQFCSAQKTLFGDTNSFSQRGGLAAMGKAMQTGMVLVMSLWDDHDVGMLWLDSNYPTTADASKPGIARGTCSATSGDPKTLETNSGNASVTFSNIKYGPIGSTYAH
jgi:cellulose 1,4-beta-cellobiosidase